MTDRMEPPESARCYTLFKKLQALNEEIKVSPKVSNAHAFFGTLMTLGSRQDLAWEDVAVDLIRILLAHAVLLEEQILKLCNFSVPENPCYSLSPEDMLAIIHDIPGLAATIDALAKNTPKGLAEP